MSHTENIEVSHA